MRVAAVLLLSAWVAPAQFKSTVPLVVAPTTVVDAKGRYVDGLTALDLVLYDNNVPQPIQIDWEPYPISLVVALQTSSNSEAVVDKMGGSGILFAQLLAADRGETALLTFTDTVTLRRDFTGDPDVLTHALESLRADGDGGCSLDAVMEALRLLGRRPPERRRVILVIAEKHDRASRTPLTEVIQEVQRQNAAIYWLTYSPFLTPFTNRKVRTVGGKKGADAEPPGDQTFNLLTPFSELARLKQPNVAELLSQATGGRTNGFLTQGALEAAIQAAGEDVHRQYILTFQPPPGKEGEFHAIRVEVKNRPALKVKTRAGYWSL